MAGLVLTLLFLCYIFNPSLQLDSMAIMFSALLLVMFFPAIALWLPEYLGFAID